MEFRLESIPQRSPAKVNVMTEVITIDPRRFANIKSFNIRMFVLFHEYAHILCQHSQVEADRLAFQLYYTRGYPLRDVIYAITRYVNKKEAKRRIEYLCRYLLG